MCTCVRGAHAAAADPPVPADSAAPQYLHYTYTILQGMVDGSASKPTLRQDTGYMVEKPYLDIVPYLGAFGAYLMPQ